MHLILSRVEDGRGGLGHAATLRFPSPLIKPDVRISRIRLSDWFHRAAHGGAPSSVRAAEAVGDGRRAQQHRSASGFWGCRTSKRPFPNILPSLLPSDPPPVRRGGCQPQSRRVSPDDPHHPSDVPCPLPRRIETGARVDCFPAHTAFPVSQAGRHPRSSLSRCYGADGGEMSPSSLEATRWSVPWHSSSTI